MSSDRWPSDMELAMIQAERLGPPPPVDPPLPPMRPGERKTHLGDHMYELRGYSNTQPFTHVWVCIVSATYGESPCPQSKTMPCTKFTDRYEPCRCFEEEEE